MEPLKQNTGSLHKKYQILGIGTPILDSLIYVPDEYINALPGARGGATLVSYPTLQQIFKETPPPRKVLSGGGAANTIKGLAGLEYPSALIGTIGNDGAGKTFSESLISCGVVPHLSIGKMPTAQAACLITPDHDRTIRAFIGAGAEMDARQLTQELFRNVRLVHIEGYLMNRKGVVEKTMHLAKEAGALISFDLSSFEIVLEYKSQMTQLLSDFVDIVFANEEEALAFTGLPPEEACMHLKDLCNIAVVKIGNEGCWGATKTEKAYHRAFKVPVVDTTGAGDLFASGFLHGMLAGKSLEEGLYCGSLLASYVIQDFGAEIPKDAWQQIKKDLKSLHRYPGRDS